jgi:RNA polymerase sigma-70 factor (ECF subfamily)
MELATAAPQPALQLTPQDGITLEGLLSKYSPAMYRAALRKLRNPADAEDALQDALLSASRNIAQFKGECHISTWLVAIAINAARMQLRRRLRQPAVSLDQTSEDGNSFFVYEPADDRPDPEENYRRTEMRGIVGQLTAELSPPLRKAFRLRGLEGFSIQEASQALGVTEGTLKAQYFRARARIHALLHRTNGLSRGGGPQVDLPGRQKLEDAQTLRRTPRR